VGSTTYTYDDMSCLTNETISLAPSHNNGAVTYGLDPVGNRTSVTSTVPDLTPISSATFTADDQFPTSIETYDPNGNVLTSEGQVARSRAAKRGNESV